MVFPLKNKLKMLTYLLTCLGGYGIQTPLLVATGAGVLALLFSLFFKETAPSKVDSKEVPSTLEQEDTSSI